MVVEGYSSRTPGEAGGQRSWNVFDGEFGERVRCWLERSERFVVPENGWLAVTVFKREHENWNVLGLDPTDAGERLHCG